MTLEPGQVTFLVGTSYNDREPSHWNVWHKSYDEVIETLRARQQDHRAGWRPRHRPRSHGPRSDGHRK